MHVHGTLVCHGKVRMMAADGLVPIWRQAIYIHHDEISRSGGHRRSEYQMSELLAVCDRHPQTSGFPSHRVHIPGHHRAYGSKSLKLLMSRKHSKLSSKSVARAIRYGNVFAFSIISWHWLKHQYSVFLFTVQLNLTRYWGMIRARYELIHIGS